MTATLQSAIEWATRAEVVDRGRPDLYLEVQVVDEPAGRPHTGRRQTNLVLVTGFAGCGKTEFARSLGGVTGWALLDKDVLTRPMVERMLTALNGDPNDRHTELYRTEVRPLEYRSLLNAAFADIDKGISTLVTAPFLAEVADPTWLRWLLHRCDTTGAHLKIVRVSADIETMHPACGCATSPGMPESSTTGRTTSPQSTWTCVQHSHTSSSTTHWPVRSIVDEGRRVSERIGESPGPAHRSASSGSA